MPKRLHRSPLTVKQIVAWAKAHQQRTGRRPHAGLGTIPEAPQETWRGVHSALKKGHRGLPGGSSLAKLLDKHCRQTYGKVPLTVGKVFSWMKRHRQRTGQWPIAASGEIVDAPGENWRSINDALRRGSRGLPAHLSLWRLRLLIGQPGLV